VAAQVSAQALQGAEAGGADRPADRARRPHRARDQCTDCLQAALQQRQDLRHYENYYQAGRQGAKEQHRLYPVRLPHL
jgi:hypothetical protein